jgi:hypothetical protein
MNENQGERETAFIKSKKILPFDRTRDKKKPYEVPSLVKLGDVAKLTNYGVSLIV